jgi:hypothetical protein
MVVRLKKENAMLNKFVLGTLAAASILGTSAVAYAGYYVPTCGVFWNGYYWVQICG